jgi:hypothetical protein
MIRDIVRTACVMASLAFASSLAIEVRFQFAAIDTAHRQAVQPLATLPMPQPASAMPKPPGRLRTFGRAVLDLADAGLGVVR